MMYIPVADGIQQDLVSATEKTWFCFTFYPLFHGK